jgi:hypothetical protein
LYSGRKKINTLFYSTWGCSAKPHAATLLLFFISFYII